MANIVVVAGRLYQDVKTYGEGDKLSARYGIAVDRAYNREESDFIPVVAFGKSAEFASKYLHKGTAVVLRGHLHSGSYTNKDGAKVYTLDVVADSIEFGQGNNARKEAAESAPAKTSKAAPAPEPMDKDEDLPF